MPKARSTVIHKKPKEKQVHFQISNNTVEDKKNAKTRSTWQFLTHSLSQNSLVSFNIVFIYSIDVQ